MAVPTLQQIKPKFACTRYCVFYKKKTDTSNYCIYQASIVLQWIYANLYFICLLLKIEESYCGYQSYLLWRGGVCFTQKACFIA